MKNMGVRVVGLLAVVGVAATLVGGWALPPTAEQQDYARLIAVHPPLAWVAYLSFGVMALGSALWLLPATRHVRFDRLASASAEVGIVFTALMLITGSIWGRPTWGVWWVWDARLTLSALMLALLLGYAALRRATPEGDRRATVAAITGLAAAGVIPVNHFAVSWWRTLHQGRSLARLSPSSQLDGSYIQVMLLGFVAMSLAYVWLLVQRTRLAALEAAESEATLEAAIEARREEAFQH